MVAIVARLNIHSNVGSKASMPKDEKDCGEEEQHFLENNQ